MRTSQFGSPGDWRLLIPAACFSAFLLADVQALRVLTLTRTEAVLVAMLPLLPFFWFVVWCVQAVERLDEMHRLIHLKALAIAFPATGALLLVLLLLDRTIQLRPGEFGFRQLPLAMAAFYISGMWLARRSYS